MKNIFLVVNILLLFSLAGCASSSSTNGRVIRPQAPAESTQEVVTAIEQVLGSVSGKPVSQKDLEKLDKEIRSDPQAKSAVKAMQDSISGKGSVIRFCPVDGQRYSYKFAICPIHKVPLQLLGD